MNLKRIYPEHTSRQVQFISEDYRHWNKTFRTMLNLKPSEIHYSQNCISRLFRGSGKPIGETLDELYTGKINVDHIPPITVTYDMFHENCYSLDNRRLWVFHYLQGAGKCSTIPVYIDSSISIEDSPKFTTKNGGVSVSVNGDPGGVFWKSITPATPTI